ncbi:NepR family anti-sigma factor [Sphingomonas sp. RS2018]
MRVDQGDMVSARKDDRTMEPVKSTRNKSGREGSNVGDALRAVYQDAISETVPDEMLDLLKKLG